MAGGGRAGSKRSPGWESLRGPVGVRGPRAQQPQNTPGETSGGGYTTAPVKSSSAKGWGEAGMEGGRSQVEEEDSQGRTTGNGEGRKTCERHGGSLLLWEARKDSALEGGQGIWEGVSRQSLQGDRRREYRQEQQHPKGRNKTQGTKQRLCAALLARMRAQLSTPHSPGRGRLQSGRHLLETLPTCRAGRERGAGTARARLPMGPPCFQEPGQGAAPLPGTPSRGLLFKPLFPSLGASNAGMPLAIHSPEQGGRVVDTPSLARGGRS